MNITDYMTRLFWLLFFKKTYYVSFYLIADNQNMGYKIELVVAHNKYMAIRKLKEKYHYGRLSINYIYITSDDARIE